MAAGDKAASFVPRTTPSTRRLKFWKTLAKQSPSLLGPEMKSPDALEAEAETKQNRTHRGSERSWRFLKEAGVAVAASPSRLPAKGQDPSKGSLGDALGKGTHGHAHRAMHTHAHVDMHTQAHIHRRTHADTHTHTLTLAHGHTHTWTHAHMDTHTQTCTQTRAHGQAHRDTHAVKRTHTRTRHTHGLRDGAARPWPLPRLPDPAVILTEETQDSACWG